MSALAIWGFVKGLPWKWIGIALAVIGLATLIYRAPWAYNRGKSYEVAKYQPVMDRALKNITTLKSNQAALTTAIDRQNAAVSALKAEGDKRTADGKAALAQAQRTNAGLKEQADALRKSAGRKVDGTPCPISDTLAKIGSI